MSPADSTGAPEPRTLAGNEIQFEAHGIRDRQDVGEDDRRVQREAAQRLQGHFAGQFRRLAQVHEAAGLRARREVFGQVTTCLAHDPDRRAVDRLAAERPQQEIVFELHGVVVPFHFRDFRHGCPAWRR
jgi:hypothetical protein